jgi:hypothetical protein
VYVKALQSFVQATSTKTKIVSEIEVQFYKQGHTVLLYVCNIQCPSAPVCFFFFKRRIVDAEGGSKLFLLESLT